MFINLSYPGKKHQKTAKNIKKRIFSQFFFGKVWRFKKKQYLCIAIEKQSIATNMVTVVQLVRASDCGSECRGFESHQSPPKKP